MNTYVVVKLIHVSCAILSVSGFLIRGAMMLRNSRFLRHKFARIAPHAVDTLLLGSAIWLSIASNQYPFVSDWLTAKLLALLAYIGFGVLALRFRRTPALFAAFLSVTYLLLVAVTRNPFIFS